MSQIDKNHMNNFSLGTNKLLLSYISGVRGINKYRLDASWMKSFIV